uniref:Sister chromatid cohesion protein n=1 Tax=Arcella intermedia TaxID=1963864 RepID=A0A6B2KW35_9EUKA
MESIEPLSPLLLSDLHSEVLKLRQQELLQTADSEDLKNLIYVLDFQIQLSTKITLKNPKESSKHEEEELRKYVLVMSGFEATLILFNIMITKYLPKVFLMEEPIENALILCKHQLRNYIFPFYDPTKEKSEESDDSKKHKKHKKNKFLEHPSSILRKITEILDKITLLIRQEMLPDSIILDATAITLPTFFVEGIYSTQLSALNVIRAIFSRYPKHRGMILDDLFNDLIKLPTSKRDLRNYQLVDQKKSIQMVSALLMHCIQCSAGIPKEKDSDNESEGVNSYTVAIMCANNFIQSFMKNCISTNTAQSNKEKEAEYRTILSNLVEDLLTTLNLPEWPSSELLLSVLGRNLVQNVVKKDTNEALRMLSIQLLGTIASRVQQDVILCKESTLFVFPKARKLNEDGSVVGGEIDECICKQTIEGISTASMIDCDRCRRWFHCECVAVDQVNPPKTWYCDPCLILRQINQHKKQLHDPLAPPQLRPIVSDTIEEISDEEIDIKEENDSKTKSRVERFKYPVIKQLILNYLAKKARLEPSCIFARQFLLSGWCYEDGDDKSNREYYESQWEANLSSADNFPSLSPDGTFQLLVQSLAGRALFKSFDSILVTILNILTETQIKYRVKGMKALTSIVEADPAILGDLRINTCVKSRFYDTSIAVRESAVDLVGKFILYRPEFAEQYYNSIVERILDKGLSVRKRVITILTKICEQQPNHVLIPRICSALVTRAHDEETTIRDLVSKTFKGLWFSTRKNSKEEIKNKVNQVVEVVTVVSERGNQGWFVDLLKEMVQQEMESRKGKSKSKSMTPISNTLALFCDCLVNNLLQYDDDLLHKSENKEVTKAETSRKIFTCILTIKLISSAYPIAIIKHLETLEPYIKSQSTDVEHTNLILNIISIMEIAVPLVDFPSSDFIDSLCKDLSTLLYSQGMPVIQAAVKCLYTVANLHKKLHLLESLFQSFITFLKNIKNKTMKPAQPNFQLSIIRALFTLGHICKWCDFDNDSWNHRKTSKEKKKGYGSHVESLFEEYVAFWGNEEVSIKVVVIMGLSQLFAPYPSILLRSNDILETAIDPTMNPRVKNQVLIALDDFLTDEEERMNLANKMVTEERIDADTGISGTTFQRILPKILALLSDTDPNIRSTGLNLVTHILKRALVHPIQCIEHLIALYTDENRQISDRAHRAVSIILEKDPKIMIGRLYEGVVLSYQFQMKLFGRYRAIEDVIGSSDKQATSIFGRLYSLIKATKSTRQSFLHIFLRFFETDSKNLDFLKFITAAIASLPFSLQEEPLYIIEQINNTIAFTGASLITSFAKIKQNPQKKKKNQKEYQLEKGKLFLGHLEDLKQACGILCLLRLKKFLKEFYSLSSAKILAFSSTDGKKTPIAKIPTDVDFVKVLHLNDIGIEGEWTGEHCLATFKMFKQEMNVDEMDYSVKPAKTRKRANTDPSQKKAPPKKKTKTAPKKNTKKKKRDTYASDSSSEVSSISSS